MWSILHIFWGHFGAASFISDILQSVFFLLQVSGAGYNDQGEIHIHKCDSPDRARESICTLLEVRMCVTADGLSHVDSRVAAH